MKVVKLSLRTCLKKQFGFFDSDERACPTACQGGWTGFRPPGKAVLHFLKHVLRPFAWLTFMMSPLLWPTISLAWQTETETETQLENEEKPADCSFTVLPDDEPELSKDSSKIPPPLDIYLGRRIAQTMHFTGAEWLIRDEREREERCSLMLANLGIKPGMTICDMGCGNGFYSLQMAKMTGEQGRVVGVDVQPEMLGFLRERMEKQGIENVIPILGSYHNPHLPPATIDLILLVDVYHEFSHPEQMLAAMRASLNPNGVIVLVEYRLEDKTVPIKPLHKMSKKQVDKELTVNGFKLVSEFDKLPWQHMLFYSIDPAWIPAKSEPPK